MSLWRYICSPIGACFLGLAALAQPGPGTGWDRARDRPAYASTSAPGHPAGRAVDGSPETAWVCGQAGGLLWVDLGARLRLAGLAHDLRLASATEAHTDLLTYDHHWQVAGTTHGAAGELSTITGAYNVRTVGLQSAGWLASGGTDTTSWRGETGRVATLLAYQAGWRPQRQGQDLLLQDFCVFPHDGWVYVAAMMKYYSPQGIAVGRSRDLVQWEHVGTAVSTRTAQDACMVWAPHVIEHEGTFYMFYTGVTCPAAGQWCQCICVAATADPADVAGWQRTDAVRFLVDGQEQSWFRPDHPNHVWRNDTWADCRDPMVLYREADRTWYLFYTGTDTNGGITGVATAPDIRGPWTDRGAVLVLSAGLPESVFVLEDPEGGFVMVFNHAGGAPDGGIKVARGGSPVPVNGQPTFGRLERLIDSTDPGLAGWAHEFAVLPDGTLLAAYLSGYWVNVQDARLVRGPRGWTVGGIPDPAPRPEALLLVR